ncbi:MAG: heme NO-binding domain-containing protein [Actinomycetes bacterium]
MFTSFVGMVEQTYSDSVADAMIDACDLPSQGAYTTVGKYDPHELAQLVESLSTITGVSPDEILYTFGRAMFAEKAARYPWSIDNATDLYSYLEDVDTTMQAEVHKLYPDAIMPSFSTERLPDGRFAMTYRSPHHLSAVCAGMIDAAVAHFGSAHTVDRTPLDDGGMCFELTPMPQVSNV